jgi:hypothetical protein
MNANECSIVLCGLNDLWTSFVVKFCRLQIACRFLIAICHQKCYGIYIKICDYQTEAMEMGQSTISVRLDDTIKK